MQRRSVSQAYSSTRSFRRSDKRPYSFRLDQKTIATDQESRRCDKNLIELEVEYAITKTDHRNVLGHQCATCMRFCMSPRRQAKRHPKLLLRLGRAGECPLRKSGACRPFRTGSNDCAAEFTNRGVPSVFIRKTDPD